MAGEIRRLTPQNLEQFNDDLTIKLRNALATYVDIVHATAATNAQATDVVRQAVERIDPSRDSELLSIILFIASADSQCRSSELD
jgi:hypothetical protein